MANTHYALEAIKSVYGYKRAKRSQVPLINHILEGQAIMAHRGASVEAIAGFMLHPLFQHDDDLKEHGTYYAFHRASAHQNSDAVMLAMEYRHYANAWLSDKVSKDEVGNLQIEGLPTWGPLNDVKEMLIADKVQNYKDFIIYHSDTHERREELDLYFKVWLKVLGIDEKEYRRLVEVAFDATSQRPLAGMVLNDIADIF
jgi:hypothetical protein